MSAHDDYLTPPDRPDALCAKCERANLDNPATLLDEPCEAHVTTDWEICVSCCLALPEDGYASCDECEHIARRYAASKIPNASDAQREAVQVCAQQDPAATVPTTSTVAAGTPKRGAA